MAKKSKTQLDEALKPLDLQAQQQQSEAEELRTTTIVKPRRDDTFTRQWIALAFVIGYFSILLILIIGIPLYNIWAFHTTGSDKQLQIPYSETLQTYSAIIGATLGFVIGYYFKNKGDN